MVSCMSSTQTAINSSHPPYYWFMMPVLICAKIRLKALYKRLIYALQLTAKVHHTGKKTLAQSSFLVPIYKCANNCFLQPYWYGHQPAGRLR